MSCYLCISLSLCFIGSFSFIWGFYFVLIYRCGTGSLFLLTVFGASHRDWSTYSLSLSVSMCVCVVMCFLSQHKKNREMMQITEPVNVCNWFPLLDLFLRLSQNSVHNYDKVMLSFCCGPKLAPITMAPSAFGTVSIGLDRGKQRSGGCLFPHVPLLWMLSDPLAAVRFAWIKPYIVLYMSRWEDIRDMNRCVRFQTDPFIILSGWQKHFVWEFHELVTL